jgi:hypothetical protein
MKFSIRDLFLVTLVVALSVGWFVDHRRAAKRDAEWHALFDEAMRQLSVRSSEERVFETPAGSVSVNRAPDPENTPRTREVIHVCDWHYLPRDVFAADLQTSADYSGDEIGRHYEQHLDDVEAVQAEQIKQLRGLIRQHGLKRIWVEGLTEDDMPAFRALVSLLKHSTENRELRLRVGVPGQLLASGELAEVLPLDEEETHRAANPLKEGHDVKSAVANAVREKMMSQRIIAESELVSVLVLGAAHDLAGQFAGHKVQYTRVMPNRVKELMSQ